VSATRETGPVPVEQFGRALGEIRDDVSEVKETVTVTRETLIKLEAEQRYMNGRVGKLESAHDTEWERCANTTAIDRIKSHITKFIYWALGISVLLVVGGFGWYEDRGTQRELIKQHTKSIDGLNKSVKNLGTKTTTQTESVQNAASEVRRTRDEMVQESKRGLTFVEWYKTLNDREKRLLKRQFDQEMLRPPPSSILDEDYE
jgi:hypothetical protein